MAITSNIPALTLWTLVLVIHNLLINYLDALLIVIANIFAKSSALSKLS